MKKNWMIVMVAFTSLVLMVPSVFAGSDLPEDHRFYKEIMYLMDKGIGSGYKKHTIDASLPVEFMWIADSDASDTITAIIESENYDGYSIGLPYSESYTELA